MTAHRIRLRGPWELEAAAGGNSPRTVRLPAPWCELFDTTAGRVRLRRRFHRPTNLGPNDRVSLVVEGLPDGAEVALNDLSLSRLGRSSEDAVVFPAPRLEPSNLLTVEFEVPLTSAGNDRTWGHVALLIDSP